MTSLQLGSLGSLGSFGSLLSLGPWPYVGRGCSLALAFGFPAFAGFSRFSLLLALSRLDFSLATHLVQLSTHSFFHSFIIIH